MVLNYDSVVKVSSSKSGYLGSTLAEDAETLCIPSAILYGTEPVSALTHTRLYCCSLSTFFFLDFVNHEWQSHADSLRVLTLNMNIRLLLFWSTWSRARGQDLATCAGLTHGGDSSCCRASEQKSQKVLGPCFSMNCPKYLKTRASPTRLEGSTRSASESVAQSGWFWQQQFWAIWLIMMLSDDLFNCGCCSKVYSNLKVYRAISKVMIQGKLKVILVSCTVRHAIVWNFVQDLATFKLNMSLAGCPVFWFCSIKTLF